AGDDGEAAALPLADLRDRLLQALSATARRHVESGAVNGGEADLISVQLFGFPAHTGGAMHFAQHA
ncbi:fatty acid oxidation complex subunit alpha, partial [Rugamonas sp. FT82W]|nr:fatty acid oxidation complex subunit alpha [Duganella vulcania]